jgi:hypothetical protein
MKRAFAIFLLIMMPLVLADAQEKNTPEPSSKLTVEGVHYCKVGPTKQVSVLLNVSLLNESGTSVKMGIPRVVTSYYIGKSLAAIRLRKYEFQMQMDTFGDYENGNSDLVEMEAGQVFPFKVNLAIPLDKHVPNGVHYLSVVTPVTVIRGSSRTAYAVRSMPARIRVSFPGIPSDCQVKELPSDVDQRLGDWRDRD